MSHRLPRKLSIDRSAIRNIKTIDDAVQWLGSFVKEIDKHYALLYDTISNFGMGTPNWDIREATAADVADGNATAVGNLIAIHKTNGWKHEFEA